MPDENQGPDARQDLNIKDLGSHKNNSSKPTSDISSIQSAHMILKLFSKYNKKGVGIGGKIEINLPTNRMSFIELLRTAIGLTIENHKKTAMELIRRWAREGSA